MKASAPAASASDAPAVNSTAREARGNHGADSLRATRGARQKGQALSSVRTWRAQDAQGASELIGRAYTDASGRRAIGATVRLIVVAFVVLAGCFPALPSPAAPSAPVVRTAPPTRYTARVVARIPHDAEAFTQGLTFHGGALYESTGLRGRSSVRVLDATSGAVTRRRAVSDEHFAEGLTVLGDRVFQITYQTQTCFVYDAATLEPVTTHTYPGEGWGLTHDGRSLILSDGTDTLRFFDPATFAERRRVRVTDHGAPVDQINELEFVEGEVFANIWHHDRIARIDPLSGRVVAWIDLPFSRESLGLEEPEAVLNGIAYEPSTRRLLVTGKLWPVIFEIALVPAE